MCEAESQAHLVYLVHLMEYLEHHMVYLERQMEYSVHAKVKVHVNDWLYLPMVYAFHTLHCGTLPQVVSSPTPLRFSNP